MFTAYLTHLLILFAIFAIAALALNLTVGWAGLVNLGHVGLIAIGAYASAILSIMFGWPIFAGVIFGMVLAAAAAVILGFLTRTVSGDALAVILLGFNFTVYIVSINWTELTRGTLGLPGIPRPEFFREDRFFLLLVLVLLLLAVIAAAKIVNSPFGRVLGALRDDELLARVLGKRVFRAKLVALAVSGALAGLAGALLAQAIRFIDPNSFFLHQLVFILSIVFVGGLASIRGTLLGAAVMTFLPELVDSLLPLPTATVGALRGIIFSALLLLVVLFRPKGLLGTVELPGAFAEKD